MSHHRRRKHHSAVAKKANQKLFRLIAPTIVAIIILCLSTTWATSAQESPINTQPIGELIVQSPTSPTTALASGNQITLNGRTLSGAWLQQRGTDGQLKTHLSDGAFRQFIGVDFLSSNNAAQQPVEWFSPVNQLLVLATRLLKGYRYLDITNFAQTAGWQLQGNGNTLAIAIPQAQIKDIRQSQQPSGVSNRPFQSARIVLDLDRPAPWQLSQGLPINTPVDSDGPTTQATTPPNREWVVAMEGIANPALIQRYAPPTSPTDLLPELPVQRTAEQLIRKLEVVNNRTIISLSVPFGMTPQIITLADPHRLVIDLRPDALVQRNITWASGLRWRQEFVNLGTERFPIVWLDINPRQAGLTLKPIGTEANTQTGTAPLIQMAAQSSAVAAINSGYFNRNNRLPLGAIRRDGQWLSGPILNRGAIAWNDSGQFYFGRLTLQETLIAPNNQKLPILFLNSGYVQSGMARYTPAWGNSYTPLTDNEIVLVVQKNRVTNQLPGGKVGETAVPIPQDGYLLTLRANATNIASQLPIGTAVSITSTTNSADFNRYPQIMGAGPLLVQNNQIVLNAESEKFSKAFSTQKAIRSGICTTASGSLLIAAVHNRAGGLGPTLAEHAQLMKNIGCVNALNLDGGSSTSLYLGGQLLDRSPNTAARVHNGIGVFLQPQ
ncbi:MULTISPECIES: phosphodiester glycosidase family protein [unclassified Nodularia (in: cyanobacteria)]|uniref:phosphodiester glycosidase family protein n=1 Tax=unclassified Nodularia (in: cyanobacteria) TaxID=2656917 RepID=UPI00187E8031|nr:MULTISPECIES: phosphodiester glycosidase family protein [unclassified Nodularia (in: cyanobacteria)]MBE9198147.1 phosphodiester glycosidase family protein [Nodularia sp. LEGE 06071]MCC2694178.1 phosphodiester glycosidase family protein [Nodularia sp. LEGE 04288]